MVTEEPLFRMTRWAEGYDQDEVDAYVDRIQAALIGRMPPPSVAEVESVRFSCVRLMSGYRIDDVDDYLARIGALARTGWPRTSRGDGSVPEPGGVDASLGAPRVGASGAAEAAHRTPGVPVLREITDPVVRELRAGAGTRVLVATVVLLALVVLAYLLVR